MKRYIRSSSDVGSSICVYRCNPTALFDYRYIPKNAELGIHAGSKLSAYVIGTIKTGFYDKLTIQPTNILDSDDTESAWDHLETIYGFHVDDFTKNTIYDAVYASTDRRTAMREVLLDLGYDCIRYKNYIEDNGDYSYIILTPKIINSVENNVLITFRGLFPNIIKYKDIRSLTDSDIIYFTNGMYDVALAKFENYIESYDDSGRTEYEINGEVVRNLNNRFIHTKGSVTNMFTHSTNIAVIESVPEILR